LYSLVFAVRRIAMSDQSTGLADLLTGAARNCWLALTEDETRIVGKGETLEAAVAEARNNGVDDPIVIWSPREWRHAVMAGCAVGAV